MSAEGCKRSWQVEALLDGRLAGPDQVACERHLEHCEPCAAELRSQRELASLMNELPAPVRTELENRRARQRLLAAANARLVGRRPARSNRWAFAASGLAMVTALLVAWMVGGRAPEAAPPAFNVADLAGAVYDARTDGTTTRVALRDGKAGFQVEPLRGAARFLVSLPDGELEVRGTRFVVGVEAGRTRSVVVSEGSVELRLAGFSALLRAGEQWTAQGSSAGAAATAAAGSATPSAASTDLPDASPTPGLESKPTASRSATVGATAAPATSGAGPRFAEAMAAYTAGNYAQADALFAAFVRDYPRDARAEDATYLRADARARRGDAAGAAAMAREYLAAFPKGLRRKEAERLAGGP